MIQGKVQFFKLKTPSHAGRFFELIMFLPCGFLYYFCKYFWIILGNVSQYFSVQLNIGFFQAANQGGIAYALLATSRINLIIPQSSKIPLFFLAASESVGIGVQ